MTNRERFIAACLEVRGGATEDEIRNVVGHLQDGALARLFAAEDGTPASDEAIAAHARAYIEACTASAIASPHTGPRVRARLMGKIAP